MEEYLRKKKGAHQTQGAQAADTAKPVAEGQKRAEPGARATDAMDLEPPASPRREQQSALQAASEALAERQQQRQASESPASRKGRGRGDDQSTGGRGRRQNGRREGRGLGPNTPDLS